MNEEIKKTIEGLIEDLNAVKLPILYKSELLPPPSTDVERILEIMKYLMFGEIHPLDVDYLTERPKAAEELFELINNCLDKYFIVTEAMRISLEIIRKIPEIKSELIGDAIAIYDGDPAARSVEEIIICYPGFLAVTVYRIAHLFYRNKVPFLPRMMTELAHGATGIDIHPGANIGSGLCIDHGTGIVIGETAVIGNNVKLYQGVTIGAKSFASDGTGRIIKGGKRHPTVGNGCIIYAGATILGGDTVIGGGSVIGGNVWLTHSVPEGSRIYYRDNQ